MYDVIVVGTRVAGASTAMLLARRGMRVLAVDRARFPSDTVSTHQVQVPGIARLSRWGLLDQLEAAGTPPTRRLRFDAGPVVLEGVMPTVDGVNALYSPRRMLLDSLLVDAARAAGAEVRERFAVTELITDGSRVAGIRGSDGGSEVTESARIVIGADGRHSLVAKAVAAPACRETSPLTVASYSYWAGVELDQGEIYDRIQPRRMVGAWPTNDGLVMTYDAAPIRELGAIRAGPAAALLSALDTCGDLGERVRAGRSAHRVVVTPDVPNRVRRPYGPGWALVGDAGLIMDPCTGQGIADAFRDAEFLADAISGALDGHAPMDAALAAYHARRDAAAMPMYEMTTDLAALGPARPEQRLLMQALAAKPAEAQRFLEVVTGVRSPADYFAPRNLMRILGMRGMVKAALARRRQAA